MKMSREKNVGDIANRHEMRKYVVRLEKFLWERLIEITKNEKDFFFLDVDSLAGAKLWKRCQVWIKEKNWTEVKELWQVEKQSSFSSGFFGFGEYDNNLQKDMSSFAEKKRLVFEHVCYLYSVYLTPAGREQ
jgi:hypothetical protein